MNNFFADLKRHDLGNNFAERNFDGTLLRQFMTEPLWGVGTTAPYGHDGRSQSLEEVILRHGGEALTQRNNFNALSRANKNLVLAFLASLVLFPPDDTASSTSQHQPERGELPAGRPRRDRADAAVQQHGRSRVRASESAIQVEGTCLAAACCDCRGERHHLGARPDVVQAATGGL